MKEMITLSLQEEDVILKTLSFGGYITKDILHLYKSDITIDRCYRILKQLEQKKFLRKRDYFNDTRKPAVFQVTRRACDFIGRPESYMRKLHKPFAVRRYLIKSHYLFKLAGEGVEPGCCFHDERERYLLSKGYTPSYLPKKIDKDIPRINIEEYIITDKRFAKKNEICFLYIDNFNPPETQLAALFGKYAKMERAQISYLSFLIVTENDIRETHFNNAYKLFYQNDLSLFSVSTVSVDTEYSAF